MIELAQIEQVGTGATLVGDSVNTIQATEFYVLAKAGEEAELLEVAGAVGIGAEVIIDPVRAERVYAAEAFKQGLQKDSTDGSFFFNDRYFGASARGCVEACGALVRFTTSSDQGFMTPFYDELARRRAAREEP